MIDVLHTVDQGVASHVVANVLWLFAVQRNVFREASQDSQVKKLFVHMKAWYKRTKASSKIKGKLTVERIRTSAGWPKLKAGAATTRHLAGYTLALVQEFGDKRRSAGAGCLPTLGRLLYDLLVAVLVYATFFVLERP